MKRYFKYLIIIFFLLTICGCTADYNLNITNNTIDEDFSTTIYKSEIPQNSDIQQGVELDDPITPFIDNDQYPFYKNNSIIYDKNIIEEDDYRLVNYKYTYSLKDYSKSNVLKTCFDKYKYSYNDNIVFNATGTFYCLHSDELNINITTKNKVLSNNADKVSGNTYTWIINKNNSDNINMSIEIEKSSLSKTINKYLLFVVGGVILLIVLIIIFFIKAKQSKNNRF